MKARLTPASIALFAALMAFLTGCGSSSGGGSASSDVASVAPPGAPVFVEGAVRPSGELKADADAVAEQIAGIDNLGDLIVSELESSARDDGEPFDYAKEVEPWLGERAGIFFETLEDGELTGGGAIIESSDTNATQEFIDTQVKGSNDPYRSASYKGVDYEFGGSEENAIGIVGDFLVVSEGEQAFMDAVDASEGDSLAEEDSPTSTSTSAT
jgi:hypothetical protein